MNIQNYPRIQFCIELNTEISEWMIQLEQLILMGDWNIEASEVETWMKTHDLTNTICVSPRFCNPSGLYNDCRM